MKRTAAIILLAGLLGGCASSIKVTHLSTNVAPTTGVPWNLAMTQYSVTITREVTSCDDKLNGDVTISAVTGKTLDRDQQYALSSDGIWATSDITSTLAGDGTSTGLNAHSEDQTAQVVASAVTFLAKAATVMASNVGDAHFVCNKKVQDAIDTLHPPGKDSLGKVVDQETAAVTAATARVTQLTTALAGDKGDRTALLRAYDDLNAKQDQLTKDQARLAANTKVVTHVQKVDWPPKADVSATPLPFRLPPDVLASWISWLPAGAPHSEVDTSPLDVYLAIYARDDSGAWAIPTDPPASANVKVGVPVRLPRVGRFLACVRSACPTALPIGWTPTDEQTLAVNPDAAVLQLGRLYTVPVTGGTFKSEAAVIALDANGVPTSVEIAEKAAAAAGAASTAAATATALAAVPDEIAAARLARTQAETSQINADDALAAAKAAAPTAVQTAAANAQLAYINASNSLVAAQAAAPTAAATAQSNAQLAYLNAANNLATAQANSLTAGPAAQAAAATALANQLKAQSEAEAAAGVQSQVSALNAQSSILNAKAAQIDAQIALKKAEAALNP